MAVTQQEIESRLWNAADELRVAMPEAQYSSVVFPLMFWKYLSDTWDHQHQQFLAENEDLLDGLSVEEAHEIEYRDYQSFEIPFIHRDTVQERRASWSSILATVTQPGLGKRVRASLQAIETANPDKFSRLFGNMAWTSEEVLSTEVLAAVMQAMDRVPKMHEGNMSHDVLGGAYEYLLKRFSDGSGTRAGQFFTPREVVELIVELLDPNNFESVYDPTCGSGGMLIASANLLKVRGKRGYTLELYGQEAVADTAGVARMNLFMHNLTQFQVEVGDTLKDPLFKTSDGSIARFDVIVANPPYSLKWKPWTKDPRAQAAVMAPVADGVTPPATPSAAEIEANNAAARAALPPNVTMKVLGELPKLNGPTYHYSQSDPAGVTIFALKTLPYSYTFTEVHYLEGETTFKPTKTSVCKDIQAWWTTPHDSGHKFKVTLNGGSVNVPPDNVARSWCWSGLSTSKTYRFTYETTGNTGGHIAEVSGKGQVRYP